MFTEKIFTYQEYLDYQNDLEKSHELVAGKIVEMPPESYQNVQIAFKLMLLLIEYFGVERVNNKAEIIVSGSRVTARIPDITIFSEEGIKEVVERNTSRIDIDMLPPLLVVEIVSPGKEARDRDYRYKYSEYAARGIQYYWIVDPQERKITFSELIDGSYLSRLADFLEGQTEFAVTNPLKCTISLTELFGS
jgi:Uma2 family endonuclease